EGHLPNSITTETAHRFRHNANPIGNIGVPPAFKPNAVKYYFKRFYFQFQAYILCLDFSNKNSCMKTGKKLLAAILFLSAFLFNGQLVIAQQSDSAKAASIKKLIDNQQYIFYAESVRPVSGRPRILSPGYTVSISKDTILCDLPYFGRTYTSNFNTTDGGIKFTAASFEYKVEVRKKGGWNITIKTKDVTDTQNLSFEIYENGKAYLQARSNNRQAINFDGYIK
ncbi:MAG TPA: DUF4251 domain-containing protein, partial [Ignavibacteriaceae bacterium]